MNKENIPDRDLIHRQIDFPFMYDDFQHLIVKNIFQFPTPRSADTLSLRQSESVVWGKYASTADEVHAIGKKREAQKRLTKPEMRYIGFISSTAGKVRAIKTSAGHGYSVEHEPSEGRYHAEISFRPSPENHSLTKSERSELRLAIRAGFGELEKCVLLT